MDFSEIVAYAHKTFGPPVNAAEALRQPLPDWQGPIFTAKQLEATFRAQKPDTEVWGTVRRVKPGLPAAQAAAPAAADAVPAPAIRVTDFGACAAVTVDDECAQAYRLRAGTRADPNSGSILFGRFRLRDLDLRGRGTAISRALSVYSGDFDETEPCGVGVMTHADGAIHWGLWVYGEAQGNGITFDPTGTMLWCPNRIRKQPEARPLLFAGEMDSGKPDRGLLVCGTAYAYAGQFVDGKPHGEGCDYDSKSGTKFEGSYAHGQRHGVGTEYRSDGERCAVAYGRGRRTSSVPLRSWARALVLGCPGVPSGDAKHEHVPATVHLAEVAQDVARLHSLFAARSIDVDAGSVYDATLTRRSVLQRLTTFFSRALRTGITEYIVTYNGHGQKGDGAWALSDGAVTFDDVWNSWCVSAALKAGAHLTLAAGSCHSGAWVDIARARKLDITVQSAADAASTVLDGRFTDWWCRLAQPNSGWSRARVLQQLEGDQPRAYTNRTGPLDAIGLPLPLFDVSTTVPDRQTVKFEHVQAYVED